MRTSILAAGLIAFAPAAVSAQSPSWQRDYATARQQATAQRKPMAIVFGRGTEGWHQLTGGRLPADAKRYLADSYVPCFVDTATSDGADLARSFELNGSVGLVISDRAGQLQAFWHEGPLTADALQGYLNKYADPNHVTRTTDTNPPPAPASYYPPVQSYAPGAIVPGFGFSRGAMMGGGCRT